MQRLRPIAGGLGVTMAQLAVAWVLHRPEVASAIVGASRPAQLEDSVAASGVTLDGSTLDAIEEALADARTLTQDFAKMVRDLDGEKLDGWLEEAEASEASAMKKSATGLKKDLSAVRAGLTEEWSNGPVKGFVNKLKLVKRQGYGRAGFGLLRARVLAA